MKTKNKMIAMLEIAVVLCSLFLVAIPAIAADQNQAMQKISAEITTASEDKTLEIYGNANEDDTIDMGDVVYTKLAIFGKKPKTELCDAKYDGRINVLDVIQTKLIILGKEKELTIVDSRDNIVTVKKPIRRVVTTSSYQPETLRTLKVPKDVIVGVTSVIQTDKWGAHYKIYFPEFQDVAIVDRADPESIITLYPDVVFMQAGSSSDPTAKACETAGITVLRFHYNVATMEAVYMDEVKKQGYIFGKRDEAEEFIDWYESIVKSIKERAEEILEEDKPKVYFESYDPPYRIVKWSYIAKTGGKDIFAGELGSSIDPEAVIDRDPDIIIKLTPWSIDSGYALDAENTQPLKEVRDEIMSRPELQNVAAVKNKKVYIISNCLATAGPQCGCRCFFQAIYMAKWFHPELFEDLDPKPIHQEYLTRFQGLDIDLDKTGVFVYPEPS